MWDHWWSSLQQHAVRCSPNPPRQRWVADDLAYDNTPAPAFRKEAGARCIASKNITVTEGGARCTGLDREGPVMQH